MLCIFTELLFISRVDPVASSHDSVVVLYLEEW